MKKLNVLIIFLLMFTLLGCLDSTDDIQNVVNSYESAESGKIYEGSYSQFKNINVETSYLGYGYDIINDEYIKKDCINLSAPILDFTQLDKIKLKFIKENNAETIEIEADSMEEFSENYSTSMKVYGKIGNVFSGGLSLDFKANSSTKTYSHYYKNILDVKTFNLYLTNSPEELKEMLSEQFKYDLMNLHPEALFDKYGTHMLKEVSMGGRIEVTSQYSSTTSGASATVKSSVNTHTKLLKFGDIDTELLLEAENSLKQENVEYYYNVKQVGGALTNINSISSLNEKYDQWLKSFDDNADYSALSGIVGETSLVALWDLLPADATERRELLYNTFKKLSGDSFEKLCNDFKINTKRTLNVIVEGQGKVNDYAYQNEDGDEITLVATPDNDSRFIGWYNGDTLVSNSATYTFDIHVNTNLKAKFKKINDDSCILLVNISGFGEVTGNESQVYKEGDSIMLTATPSYNNTFLGWYINNELMSDNDFYIFNITNDTTIVAKFTNNVIEAYKLVVNKLGDGDGTLEYETEFSPKSIATVTATSNDKSKFVGWYINNELVSTNRVYSFIITSDTIVFAKFDVLADEEFATTITVLPENKGDVKGNKVSYKNKELVTLEAIPNEGYKFVKWKVNGEDIFSNPYSFNISTNINIIVIFEEKEEKNYTLNYVLNNEIYNVNATISSQNLIVNENVIPQFKIPESQYLVFQGWYIDDTIQISDGNGSVIHNVNGYTDAYGRWIGEGCNLVAKWIYNSEYKYIYNINDFNKIASQNNGSYVLLNDLDFANESVVSIAEFRGTIDGNNRKISNWSCVQNAISNYAIIIKNKGIIKNLQLEKCTITNNDPNGNGLATGAILCSENHGTIYNVSANNCSISIDVGSINNNHNNYAIVSVICATNYNIIDNININKCELNVYAGTEYEHSEAYVGIVVGRSESGTISNVDSNNNIIYVMVKADYSNNIFGSCKKHGAPRGYVGSVIGYASNTNINGNMKELNNAIDFVLYRKCNCSTNKEYCKGGYIGKAVGCIININK